MSKGRRFYLIIQSAIIYEIFQPVLFLTRI